MAENQPQRRPRRRRRRSLLGRLVTFLVICLVLFLGISVFFKVSEIEVDGDTRYTDEQIIDASGVSYGDHLFFINRSSISSGIRSRLAYVDEVTVTRRFPNRLEITVNDGAALASVAAESGYLILDKQCRVLEVADAASTQGLITLTGIAPILPVEGEIIALGEEDSVKVTYLQELLTLLEDTGLAADVGEIDITLAQSLTFTYTDRFKVLMGPNRDLSYKLKMLEGVVTTLEDYETGTIDLTEGEPAHFRPD